LAFDNLVTNPNGRKYVKSVVLWAFLLSGAASLLGISSHLLSSRVAPQATLEPPPDGIKVKLIPTTFSVEARQAFRLKAVADFDPTCGRIDCTIADQQWEQSFTRAELLNGIQAQWNPRRTGTFRMQFFCDGRPIGDTGLSVVMPPDRALKAGARKFRWVLSYGKPVYRDNSFFEIPIMASSEEKHGSTFVPSVVNRDIYLNVREQNGQLSKIDPILIQKNTAISDPVYLGFPVGSDYRLIAFERDSGQASNELGVSWTQLSPKLSLVAYPDTVNLYSAAISSASVRLYIAQDSRQIKPSEKMEILFAAPAVFKSDPPTGISLSPTEPVGIYRVSAASETGNWSIGFREPKIGMTTSASIKVLSTIGFSLAAIGAGLVGVLVARRRGLFQQQPWAVVIELICAGAAAFLLHGMILAGWIKVPGASEFMLGYFAAVLVGLVGGYVGLGVFQAAKALILKRS
jgi:hypothetical protein